MRNRHAHRIVARGQRIAAHAVGRVIVDAVKVRGPGGVLHQLRHAHDQMLHCDVLAVRPVLGLTRLVVVLLMPPDLGGHGRLGKINQFLQGLVLCRSQTRFNKCQHRSASFVTHD